MDCIVLNYYYKKFFFYDNVLFKVEFFFCNILKKLFDLLIKGFLDIEWIKIIVNV